MSRPNYNSVALLVVVALLLSAVAVGVGYRLNVTGLSPISAYQGIHPSFEAVGYENRLYTTTDKYDASVCNVGPATINWDPDSNTEGLPNLRGELRDIQIVRDLSQYEVGDAMSHIVRDFGGIINPNQPYKFYEWKVDTDGDGKDDKEYRMELWLCSMEVNIWADPDRSAWWTWSKEVNDQHYPDVEIWLELEASQDWGTYFQGVEGIENTYFGLAYLELAELDKPDDRTRLQVVPGSKWSAFDVYDSLGGYPESPDDPVEQAYVIKGAQLNPSVFKARWFTKVSLSDIGTYGYNILDGSFKSDFVQVKALAHVFVVGEWTVQPEEERDLVPPEPPSKEGWLTTIVRRWAELMESPLGRLRIAIWLAVIIVLVVIFFNPGLLITLWGKYSDLYKNVSSRGKKGKS